MKKLLLVVLAILCGIATQVIGAMLDKVVHISIGEGYNVGVLGLITTILGFVVMVVLIRRWVVR